MKSEVSENIRLQFGYDIGSHRQKVRLEAQSSYIEWTTLCGCVAHILLLLFIFEIALNDKSNGQLQNQGC